MSDVVKKIYRGMEQLVARRAHNPKVAGSSPAPATKTPQRQLWGVFCFIATISATNLGLNMEGNNEQKPYKLARLVNRDGDLKKRWYVEYYAWSEKKEGLVRKQVFIPAQFTTKAQREKEADKYIKAINRALEAGKYFKDGGEQEGKPKEEKKPEYSLIEGLRYAFDIKLNQGKKRTTDTFRSFQNILIGYLEEHREIGGIKLEEVRTKHIYSFLDSMQKTKKLSNRTRNNYRDSIVTLFNELIRRELVEKNPAQPIESLSTIQGRHTPFIPCQRKTMEEHLLNNDKQLFYFTRFIYYAFLRPNEIVQLKIANINMLARSIIIPGQVAKNNRQQSVTIIQPLYDLLMEMDLDRYSKNDYIFSKDLLPGRVQIYPTRVSERHRAALEATELYDGKITLYSWKHTGAVNAILAGLDIKKLKEHLRHHSLEQTDIYLRSLGVSLDKDMRDKSW
jgi:integrase